MDNTGKILPKYDKKHWLFALQKMAQSRNLHTKHNVCVIVTFSAKFYDAFLTHFPLIRLKV